MYPNDSVSKTKRSRDTTLARCFSWNLNHTHILRFPQNSRCGGAELFQKVFRKFTCRQIGLYINKRHFCLFLFRSKESLSSNSTLARQNCRQHNVPPTQRTIGWNACSFSSLIGRFCLTWARRSCWEDSRQDVLSTCTEAQNYRKHRIKLYYSSFGLFYLLLPLKIVTFYP